MLSEDDEMYKLVQKGFYVEPPSKPISKSMEPSDGSEFIHKSRLEEVNLKFDLEEDPVDNSDQTETAHAWGRKKALEFSRYTMKLLRDKKLLIKKFPQKLSIPDQDVGDWCLFCLGTDLCSRIFPELDHSGQQVEGHDPALSIVLHLPQSEVQQLLRYLHEWYLVVGLKDSIGRWMYALFACLERPLDDDLKDFLEVLYENLKKSMGNCEASEREQVKLIFALLQHYFLVKSFRNGVTLDRFIL